MIYPLKRRPLQGKGINDVDYNVCVMAEVFTVKGVRKQKWLCPYYRKWSDMLRRCYSESLHMEHETYRNCTVCEEWLTLSSFIRWVNTQTCLDWTNKHLDKDFLFDGNKVYSPETCVFLTGALNKFVLDSGSKRGEYMIGVTKSASKKNPYMSQCVDPLKRFKTYLGVYSSELEAHLVWKSKKHEYACELAELEVDERVKQALRTRYL